MPTCVHLFVCMHIMYFFLAMLHSLWDLSSTTRDCAPAVEVWVLTTGLPGNSLYNVFVLRYVVKENMYTANVYSGAIENSQNNMYLVPIYNLKFIAPCKLF